MRSEGLFKIGVTLALLFLLVGCQEHIVYKDRWRDNPVLVFSQPPTPAELEKLDLPIYHLSDHPTKAEISKAVVDSLDILTSRVKQGDTAIEPFRNHDAAAPANPAVRTDTRPSK